MFCHSLEIHNLARDLKEVCHLQVWKTITGMLLVVKCTLRTDQSNVTCTNSNCPFSSESPFNDLLRKYLHSRDCKNAAVQTG